MRRVAIRSLAVALVATTAAALGQVPNAARPWQKVQMPTAAEVAKVWSAPPPEYGPEPYFGMNGPVTIASLAKDLDAMKAMGFHAVTAQPGGGMAAKYLTPEYFAFFKQFALEAKKRDMNVWIVDDIGYPSGFAGGKFANSPLRMQALTIGQRVPVAAGASAKQNVPADTVAVTAVNSSGEHMPVPVNGGAIDWTAPADKGDWTVVVIEHVFRTSPTKSDTNPTHQKDSSQPLEDYLNPEATAAYLNSTHEGYYKAMPELFGTTILGFRGDEPDYSISGLPWTPAFFDKFQQIKGYDIRPYVAAILMSQGGGRQRPGAPAMPPLPKLSEQELRAKGDYDDVFSLLFRDGFFKPQLDWCAAHGVEYQVHLNHEEMEMELTRSEGEFIRDMKYVQMPGIDTIWHQIWTDTISDFPRLASSASHIYGYPRAFTETFAAYRPSPDVTMARYILNEQMVRGVNLIETMFLPATRPEGSPEPPRPTTAPPGANLVRPRSVLRDPEFPALMEYVRRLSYVLSMGRPAASVALYIPSSSMWLNDKAADDAFVSTERMLSERQIDFDIVNDDALATDLKAKPGAFETASGNEYRVVIVPNALAISEGALGRLKAFAKSGGNVLFLGSTPTLIYGRTMLDARAPADDEFSFATVETSAQLEPTPTPPMQPPASAPGPQVVPPAIEAAVQKAISSKTITLDKPDTALRVMTRRLKDADVYFFFNENAQPFSHSLTLKTNGKTAESWDAQTATISPISHPISANGAVKLKLDLKPYETRLVVVR